MEDIISLYILVSFLLAIVLFVFYYICDPDWEVKALISAIVLWPITLAATLLFSIVYTIKNIGKIFKKYL